jgi:hypothetical protein
MPVICELPFSNGSFRSFVAEQLMLPANYRIRPVEPADYSAIVEICRRVYPTENPYTQAELDDHLEVFAEGQFAAVETTTGAVAGVHFTLRLSMNDFHVDDSWEVLTAGGTFLDHNPTGHSLYGADIMVHPDHQHHGLAHALTDRARLLVEQLALWRMVGASRLPGYGKHASTMTAERYVAAVVGAEIFDPVLSIHLKDGWSAVKPIYGYLPHDDESARWAAVIQWVNPACPPPEEFDLGRLATVG